MTMKISQPDAVRWPYLSRVTATFQLVLATATAILLIVYNISGISTWYFFDHDLHLITASSVALALLSFTRLTGRPVAALTPRTLALVCALAGAVAYIGAYAVFHHYAGSRDEQVAEFAATYLAAGHLGWAIPAPFHDLGTAMMPLYTITRPLHWTSDYLPINSALRAPFELMGDQWLAGAVLLVIGLVSLWSAARRIWPEQPHAATVAVVMAAASTQVLLNAATPYAMTAHFALNALWLACFLRGGKAGNGTAITVGVLASGLHQSHFHITFVLGFVLWLAYDRRYRLAALYLASCIGYYLLWRFAYPALLDATMGLQVGTRPIPPSERAMAILNRVLALQPGESLTRFIAWQNLLLMPLFVVGAATAARLRGTERILIGCTIACILGLLTPIVQDHGFGYRYLHHLLPCFCLLAAAGWVALERSTGTRLPAKLLWASVAFAVLVTLPVAVWRTMVEAAPFERAYRAALAADTDYLLVDPRAGAYVQGIVRVDQRHPTPVILDLGYVPAAAVARLCAHSRTMLFGEAQARAFGIQPNIGRVDNEDEAAARRAQLAALRCAPPMPVG